jgi:hypothetical protein
MTATLTLGVVMLATLGSPVLVMGQTPSTPNTLRLLGGVAVGTFDNYQAELLREAGVKWIRSDVDFGSTFSNTYAISRVYGLNIIGILDYSLVGYNASFTLRDWKILVARAQRTYPLIRVWEIWNEPTLPQFQVGYMDGNPRHYVGLLRSAFRILRANDPSAKILGLGGAQLEHQADIEFAKAIFALGGGAWMDAISIHAYPYQLNIGRAWNYYEELWHEELQQYKALGKPFWITETGLQSSQHSEVDQANFLLESSQLFGREGASAYVWYMLNDYVSTSSMVTYGLLTIHDAPKSSYSAFKSLQS